MEAMDAIKVTMIALALAAGDIDGDGRADLVAGAPGQTVSRDANAGSMLVIFG